jgi:hypothetical protein
MFCVFVWLGFYYHYYIKKKKKRLTFTCLPISTSTIHQPQKLVVRGVVVVVAGTNKNTSCHKKKINGE